MRRVSVFSPLLEMRTAGLGWIRLGSLQIGILAFSISLSVNWPSVRLGL